MFGYRLECVRVYEPEVYRKYLLFQHLLPTVRKYFCLN